MTDIEKLLAGRKAIDDYEAAHAEVHSEHLLSVLLLELERLGCNSVDEFFEFNKASNLEEEKGSYEFEGECDFCVGREKACVQSCYENLTELDVSTPTGRTKMAHTKSQVFETIEYWKDYFAVPMKLGEIKPQFPGCSILIRCVRPLRFDTHWR